MERNAEPAALVSGLAEDLARIGAVKSRLTSEEAVAAPPWGGWSANEILWHIRATADVYGEHIARILTEEEPRWRHKSPRARMKKSRYDAIPFAESFGAFETQRTELLALLRTAPPGAWGRAAIVKVEKRDWRLTLHERVRGFFQHEAVHCAEMEALVNEHP